eukprot:scaffold106552_cov28-Phaeocystis_antarctica.AAC.1
MARALLRGASAGLDPLRRCDARHSSVRAQRGRGHLAQTRLCPSKCYKLCPPILRGPRNAQGHLLPRF